ncbi:MAG: hypothetical protein ACE5HQ_03230 [Gemmatimonadota bacterium]
MTPIRAGAIRRRYQTVRRRRRTDGGDAGRLALRGASVLAVLCFAPQAARTLGAQELGSDLLTIRDHPDRQELVLALGPIDLPAHTSHHKLQQMMPQRGEIPFDLMVHGYRTEAVDRDGNPVPHLVIHHFNLLDPTRRELFLPIMRRVFASGSETGAQRVPKELFGLPLKGGDPFILLTMLHNPTAQSYRGVRVRLILDYSRGTTPLYRVYPFHMDAGFPLGSKAFDLPPGRSVHSWEGSPAIPGAILAVGGHLHPYAQDLKLEDVTEGKVLYEIHPTARPDGQLESVPVKMFMEGQLGVPIDPSHVYRVSATYDNPTGKTIPEGGMGSVAGVFIPGNTADWPPADPRDPLYATDYRNVLASTTMEGPGFREPVPVAPESGPRAQAPPLPVGRDHLVRIVDHPDENALELVVGPARLSPGGHHVRLPVQLIDLPLEGWLHGFRWEMTDGAGRKLPDELLHHINLIDPDQRELFSEIPRRVMAAGRETGSQEMPRFLGYPVKKGTRLMVSAMFARPTKAAVPEAYLHVFLSYTRAGANPVHPRDVYPFYLDVMGPVGRKSFVVPAGGTERSWTGSPAIDGRLVAIGAHLHDRARSIRLEDVTAGQVVWQAEPQRDENGHVTGVPTALLWARGGIPIHRDHQYRIVVAYDNPTGRPDPEPAMGEIGGILLADPGARWPALKKDDPAYVADLTNTLEAPEKLQGH